jgi:hypothetical protein
MMNSLRQVTYCGLYCPLCAQCGRIPDQASALRTSMEREGYTYFGDAIPGFQAFWDFLTRLSNREQACTSCREGGGDPSCEIRTCARERNVVVCPLCADFPCERIETLARRYSTLIPEGRRLRTIGIDAWIAEQQQRVAAGVCYADIRLPG